MKKFYRCTIGMGNGSNTHYFIPGKIYKVDKVEVYITSPDLKPSINSDLITIIDELGGYQKLPSYIFREHFNPLRSNKRKRRE